jgi:UPF0489 domain
MSIPNFDALTEDPAYLANLGAGVWLMDDHRWALKVWETERRHDRYTLVHADYHWDGCYDFHDQPEAEAQLVAASSAEVAAMVKADYLIQYDSFIAPAVKRGLVHTIHFYCLQRGMGDEALDEEFLHGCGATQFTHASPGELANTKIAGPMIFDLCLDLFNRSDVWAEGDLWPDKEILTFLEVVRPMIRRAELVTVSMSFNHSGTAADTRHLSGLVVPRLLEYRIDA